MTTINLTKKTWIFISENAIESSKEEFDEFWSDCPKTKETIEIFGTKEVPRFQKMYGSESYTFSGMTLKPDPDVSPEDYPELLKKCFAKVKEMYPEIEWNGALVNFYPDGDSYIGPHSDDEKKLISGAPICSFSFGATRTFRLKRKIKKLSKELSKELSKKSSKDKKPKESKELSKKESKESEEILKYDIPTTNGSLIVMGGHCQKEYKHEITKTKKFVGPRINVTIRSFIPEEK
jgi:alkylated DNA repair dioxygenase AlkB